MFHYNANNAILMFHRVACPNPGGLPCHEHLKVTPEYFEQLLLKFRGRGYSFVSMDEMADSINHGKKTKKTLAVTFDDGFADNYTTALPILKSLNIPAIVYVATGLISREYQSAWERLESLIVSNSSLVFENGAKIPIETMTQKEECFLALRQMILLSEDQYTMFDALCKKYLDVKHENTASTTVNHIGSEDRIMTVDELKAWAKEPLCSVGSHTHSHIVCGDMASAKIQNDILHSLNILRDEWEIPVRHFAYPYGDPVAIPHCNTADFWKENGIVSCVTTQPAFIRSSERGDPYFMPRYMVSMFEKNDLPDKFVMLEIYELRTRIKKIIRSILCIR